MQHSTRSIVDGLRKIKSQPINLAEVTLNLARYTDPLLRRIYIKKLVGTIVETDTLISVQYENISESDWDSLTSQFDTPIENQANKKLKEKINKLGNAIVSLYNGIEENDFDYFLNLMEKYVFLLHSRNVQFLIYKLLEIDEEKTVDYFMDKIKNDKVNTKSYLTYFISILIRYKVGKSVEKKAVKFFLNQFNCIENKDTIVYMHYLQMLLYLCCFKPHLMEKSVRICIDSAYKQMLFKKLNKKVVEIFCKIFEYKCPIYFDTTENEIFFFFPLDPPILPVVDELVFEKYVEWGK